MQTQSIYSDRIKSRVQREEAITSQRIKSYLGKKKLSTNGKVISMHRRAGTQLMSQEDKNLEKIEIEILNPIGAR